MVLLLASRYLHVTVKGCHILWHQQDEFASPSFRPTNPVTSRDTSSKYFFGCQKLLRATSQSQNGSTMMNATIRKINVCYCDFYTSASLGKRLEHSTNCIKIKPIILLSVPLCRGVFYTDVRGKYRKLLLDHDWKDTASHMQQVEILVDTSPLSNLPAMLNSQSCTSILTVTEILCN